MISAFRSSMFVHYSHGGLLSYGSPVVVFFDRGHPRFRNFYSIVAVDVVRVNINSHMLTITLMNNTDLRTTLLTGTLRNLYAKPTAPTTFNDLLWKAGLLTWNRLPSTGVNHYRHHTNDSFTTLTLETNRTERPNFTDWSRRTIKIKNSDQKWDKLMS